MCTRITATYCGKNIGLRKRLGRGDYATPSPYSMARSRWRGPGGAGRDGLLMEGQLPDVPRRSDFQDWARVLLFSGGLVAIIGNHGYRAAYNFNNKLSVSRRNDFRDVVRLLLFYGGMNAIIRNHECRAAYNFDNKYKLHSVFKSAAVSLSI